eukprot:CAMPEP_0204193688 /NCGR_PEP_ID=MMETSP0361-20130328/61833_1 /ASSEMBLY_ACC=CAM_ASM_000343 /TAXON_ID=268821 /ORGANISM="Scrippsiella Hangoei, Strain SHTV-5" /LENGTH=80 /DNA_ID=CAMNT_0051154941 /DNA_START=43 /DNA_END=282 /DNA_ORIENTATION=-
MGASACSHQRVDACPPCCSGGKSMGSDMLAEYMPQNVRQANREHVEPAPPHAAAHREGSATTYCGTCSHPSLGGGAEQAA